MKFLFKIFVLLGIFFVCSCHENLNEEQKILKYVEKRDKRAFYEIDGKLMGNFTDSNKKEVLIFFNTTGKKNKNEKSKRSMVFIFDDEDNILNAYDTYYRKYKVDDRKFIKEIDKFDIRFDNAIITDFNGNGKLEFIYFVWEGSVCTFHIEEFKNGEFRYVCPSYNGDFNTYGLYNYDLDHFDFETKSMYLTERPPYHEKIKLTWNPNTEFYEMEVLQE